MAVKTTMIRATEADADALRRLAGALTAETGKRVTFPDVVALVVTVAQRHPEEIREALALQLEEDST